MKVVIETESEEDYEQISMVHAQAFNGESEAHLVEKLRTTPMFIPRLSLVARDKNEVIGHILFYPIKIKRSGKECVSLALAPVSVLPEFQNKKIGSRLIKEGLAKARKLGFKSVIVLGHPKYYPRFGFEKASKYGILAPFKVPDNAFLAIELKKDGLKDCTGTVEYPKEFQEV